MSIFHATHFAYRENLELFVHFSSRGVWKHIRILVTLGSCWTFRVIKILCIIQKVRTRSDFQHFVKSQNQSTNSLIRIRKKLTHILKTRKQTKNSINRHPHLVPNPRNGCCCCCSLSGCCRRMPSTDVVRPGFSGQTVKKTRDKTK